MSKCVIIAVAVTIIALLAMAEPTIAEAGARCVNQGAKQVILVPYFLSAGVHVGRDFGHRRRDIVHEL